MEHSASFCALVADDNPVSQRLLVQLLLAIGAEVDWVDNGQRAVEAVAARAYDLVLMDYRMPVLDGLEATRIIAGKPDAPPIVIVSSSASEEDRQRSRAAGAFAHLEKPVSPAALVALIQQALSDQRKG